jgi:alpha-beta hydrolase superfamily lysophospholipase
VLLIGMSMGGYLAPRAAAFDQRIDGVIAYNVFFDSAQPHGATPPPPPTRPRR